MLLVKCSSSEFLCHLSDHLWEVVIVAPPPVLSGTAVVQFLWPRVSWNGNEMTGMRLASTLQGMSTGDLTWVTSSWHHVYQPPVAASSHLLLEVGTRACCDDVTHWALTSDHRPVNSLAPVVVCSILHSCRRPAIWYLSLSSPLCVTQRNRVIAIGMVLARTNVVYINILNKCKSTHLPA